MWISRHLCPRPTTLLRCALLVCIGISLSVPASSQTAASDAPSQVSAESLRAFLSQHCVDCHEGPEAEAGLDITALDAGVTAENFDRWVRAWDRVHEGEMPPSDAAQASAEELSAFLQEARQWLQDFQQEQLRRDGRVRQRQLTNLQLERSLHALLGVDIPLATALPDEPRTAGFTNVADGQSISHFQLQQHLDVVDRALDEAFRRAGGADDEEIRMLSAEDVARTNPRRRCREPEMIGDEAVVWSSRLIFYGRLPATTAKTDGWYRFTIRASARNAPSDHGVWCTVRTGRCVSSAPLLGWVGAFAASDEAQTWTFETWLNEGEMLEVRPGDRTVKMARFQGGQVGTGEGEPQHVPGVAIHEVQMRRIHRGGDAADIAALLFDDLRLQPATKKQPAELQSQTPSADAAHLLHRFAHRAFRREVAEDEISHYVAAVQQAIEQGQPLLQALRDGYRALLCSPYFLYFHETPGPLADAAIATRLSYFLRAAPPDDQLRQLAAAGKLRDPVVLDEQVDRLLSGVHGERFIEDFANQWLDLRDIDSTEPDQKLFREFDIIVQQSMLEETQTFLSEMLQSDAPVRQLIDSDHTFLNNRLARFYDIEGVQGDAMQRVSLSDSDHRGGVLTQGAILKVTANGTTTSPVLRGVWISERLLGQPIAPPPESVPAIEPDVRGATTIRELLEKHRSASACASCHVKIDPPGFALENYDPAGQWRTHYERPSGRSKQKAAKIDPSYRWPDGSSFDDIRGFRASVLSQPERIAANVAEKMVVYGTGGSVEFADRQAIQDIVESTRDSEFGFRSILKAVVTSELFLNK